MSALSIVESAKGQFTLAGDLNRNTIPQATGLDTSKQLPADNNTLLLDMTEVKHTDTAGLAWVMNLLKQARGQGLECQLKGVPQSLINLAKISDVDSFLSVQ